MTNTKQTFRLGKNHILIHSLQEEYNHLFANMVNGESTYNYFNSFLLPEDDQLIFIDIDDQGREFEVTCCVAEKRRT